MGATSSIERTQTGAEKFETRKRSVISQHTAETLRNRPAFFFQIRCQGFGLWHTIALTRWESPLLRNAAPKIHHRPEQIRQESRMSNMEAQIWTGSSFSIERREGKAPGSVIFHLSGPFTARDMYRSVSPEALRNLFEAQSDQALAKHIFDLTDVPYMDSIGLGMLVSQYVRCQGKGMRMVAAGVSPRVLQLLKLTKLDSFIPMADTIEEAESN
jgi:anti-anti-sigma factor